MSVSAQETEDFAEETAETTVVNMSVEEVASVVHQTENSDVSVDKNGNVNPEEHLKSSEPVNATASQE